MPYFDSENIMLRPQSILDLFRMCQLLYIPSSLFIINNFISDTVIRQYNCCEREKGNYYRQLKRFSFNLYVVRNHIITTVTILRPRLLAAVTNIQLFGVTNIKQRVVPVCKISFSLCFFLLTFFFFLPCNSR